MKRVVSIALVLVCCWAAAPLLRAQAPAAGDSAGSAQSSSQNKPAPEAPKPAAEAPSPTGSSNPFPEDTSSVPVMPSAVSSPAPQPAFNPSGGVHLPGGDNDPVRSPDDASSDSGGSASGSSSSSLQGLGDLLEPPPDEGKRGKDGIAPPVHQVTAKEDISVGSYYLQTKNWKGALSRFQSAFVLAPENPEVYWGLAECQRHLGQYAEARANYLKVMEYDPESKHGKEARKILKQPEMANAQSGSSSQTAETPRK